MENILTTRREFLRTGSIVAAGGLAVDGTGSLDRVVEAATFQKFGM